MTQWMHSLIAGVLMHLTWSFYLKNIPEMQDEIRRQETWLFDKLDTLFGGYF